MFCFGRLLLRPALRGIATRVPLNVERCNMRAQGAPAICCAVLLIASAIISQPVCEKRSLGLLSVREVLEVSDVGQRSVLLPFERFESGHVAAACRQLPPAAIPCRPPSVSNRMSGCV